MKKFILFIIFCTSFLYSQDRWGIWLLTKDNQFMAGNNKTDTIPGQLNFVDVTNVNPGSWNTTTLTLTNFDSCYFKAGTDSFSVNAGAKRLNAIKVYRNNIIHLYRVASSDYATTVTVTATAGGSVGTWDVATRQDYYIYTAIQGTSATTVDYDSSTLNVTYDSTETANCYLGGLSSFTTKNIYYYYGSDNSHLYSKDSLAIVVKNPNKDDALYYYGKVKWLTCNYIPAEKYDGSLMSFDGSTETMRSGWVNTDTAFTIIIWFKKTDAGSSYVFSGREYGGGGIMFTCDLYASATALTFNFIPWFNQTFTMTYPWPASERNSFNQVIISVSNGRHKMYLNGVQVAISSYTGITMGSIPPICVGSSWSTNYNRPANYFIGDIGDFQIIDKYYATPAEALDLYNNGMRDKYLDGSIKLKLDFNSVASYPGFTSYNISGADRTQRGIYAKSSNNVLTIPLATPLMVSVTCNTDYSLDLIFANGGETDNTSIIIQRRIPAGVWADIATVARNAVSYTDIGLTLGNTYEYRIANYKTNRYYSTTVSGQVTLPGASITFDENPFNVDMIIKEGQEGVAEVPETTYPRTLAKVDFEEAKRSDFTDSTTCYPNATKYTVVATDTLGSYGSKVAINSSSPFLAYGSKSFTAEDDTVSGAFWIYLSSSLNTPEATNYGQMYFFNLWDNTNDVFYIGVKWNNATPKVIYRWDFLCTDGSSNAANPTTPAPTFNRWTKIEWQYIGNQAGTTGGVKVWIDDALTYDYQTHANSGVQPDKYFIGLVDNGSLTWSANTAYYYIGDQVVCGGTMPNYTGFTPAVPEVPAIDADSTVTLTVYSTFDDVQLTRFTYNDIPTWVTVDTTGYPKTIDFEDSLKINFVFDRDNNADTSASGTFTFTMIAGNRELDYNFTLSQILSLIDGGLYTVAGDKLFTVDGHRIFAKKP